MIQPAGTRDGVGCDWRWISKCSWSWHGAEDGGASRDVLAAGQRLGRFGTPFRAVRACHPAVPWRIVPQGENSMCAVSFLVLIAPLLGAGYHVANEGPSGTGA